MAEVLAAEVVVVGAGPAGIAAACRSAEAGAEVLLVDEGAIPGGQIWRQIGRTELSGAARRWIERLARSEVKTLGLTTVVDALPDRTLIAERGGGEVLIRGDDLIVATGARELFLPFPGWTLPGVIGVGAAQALLKSGARLRGQRTVIAGSGPLLLPVAAALRAAGADLRLVAEQASASLVRKFAAGLWRMPGKLGEALRYRWRFSTVAYRTGVWVLEARGGERVEEVVLSDGSRTWPQPCDLLCCAYGLVPNVELARWLGCETTVAGVVVDEQQRTTIENVFCVGEVSGVGGVEIATVEGEIAGAVVTGREGRLQRLQRRRRRLRRFEDALQRAFAPRAELKERLRPETTICRCEDVLWRELESGWQRRQAKLYTRLGMGPCQGRVCGPAVRFLLGWEADSVRPPLKPCRVATLAAATAPATDGSAG